MRRLSSFLSLFASSSTIVCCALPALFVLLGAGASFAGLVSTFPQLIWLSEHKILFFGFGGIMLILAGAIQWQSRKTACPVDDILTQGACRETKNWSLWVYFTSVGLYLIGAGFAFLPQLSS